MRSIILSVAKKHVRGAVWNRKGQRIRYRGKKTHWTVYFLDDLGLFHTEQVTIASVLSLKARVQRILTYRCEFCNCRFRSNKKECPSCNSSETVRIKRKS